MDLRGLTPTLTWLWNDRMDLTHSIAEETPDGDNVVYPEEPSETDIPCRISFGSGHDSAKEVSMFEPVVQHPVVFCAPDISVVAGDRIVVRRCHSDGTVYATFTGCVLHTGKPSIWDNHQEFEVVLEGDA